MSEALQQLIQQAELQKIQMQMNLLYAKNLELFKERMPMVHKLMSQHEAGNVALRIDPNNQVNLLHQAERHYLYNDIPSDFCRKQVDLFRKSSKVRRLRVTRNKAYNPEHIHIPSLNALVDEYEENQAERITETPDFITSLIVTGVGLGYHIETLVKEFDIQNIVIYEKCIDTFHGSMHVLDWTPILDYFRQSNHSISICVGTEPRLALAQMESSLQKIGLHSQMFTYVYRHTMRKVEIDFIDVYQKELRAYVGGLGYFDDEQIGLAHAYHNLKSDSAVFINRKSHQRKPRLLLIGNGPSLDEHQSYIERNRDNAIIMSCGTGLSSLLRMGIKPDFHVEMERCIMVNDVIRHFSKNDERNDITLLCLHTVAPETIKGFPDACYAIKANDAGGSLVHDYYHPQKVNELVYCNPTVANCGLSFAVSMGFENIHLIGVDFGVKEAEKHHSKHSVYNEMEAFAKKEKIDYTIYDENRAMPCKGNFGGEVMAMPTLNMARISVERYLKLIKPMFPNLRCINTNNGAYIEGTESIHLSELDDCKEVDIEKEVKDIKESHFHYQKNDIFENKNEQDLLKYFYSIQDKVKISTNISNNSELYHELRRAYRIIGKDNDLISHFLLRGSFNTFFGCIVENSMYCTSEEALKNQIEIGARHFNQFIDDIYEKMAKSPFKLDETYSGYVKAMKEKETENSKSTTE
ncbi:MAG: DUF115 domain-containing protein [Agarilytica sp.]